MIWHSRRGLLEHRGCLWGVSWGLLGVSWPPPGGLLGASGGHLGAILGPLGASWALLRVFPLRRPKWAQNPSKTNDAGFLAEAVLDALTTRDPPPS
eukprot:6197211-Pyramimonas_sp.AAC.1